MNIILYLNAKVALPVSLSHLNYSGVIDEILLRSTLSLASGNHSRNVN